jgi:MerR family regulatory protein
MERIVGISEAAEALGVAISTLRRWEASGKMVAEHTVGGHRRYDLAKLRPELFRAAEAAQRKTIAYAILDRLVHNAHRLTLNGDSMSGRKLCGVSLWRGTLWRGSQEPRETVLGEAGTEPQR